MKRSESGRDQVALSKDYFVAKGNGGGAGGLSFGAQAASRGDIRDAFADHARSSVSSSQYRGRLNAGDTEGQSTFLAIAQGSLAEAETLLTLCEDLDWFPQSETRTLRSLLEEISRMLTAMRRRLRALSPRGK